MKIFFIIIIIKLTLQTCAQFICWHRGVLSWVLSVCLCTQGSKDPINILSHNTSYVVKIETVVGIRIMKSCIQNKHKKLNRIQMPRKQSKLPKRAISILPTSIGSRLKCRAKFGNHMLEYSQSWNIERMTDSCCRHVFLFMNRHL